MTELPFNPGASLLVFPCAIEDQDIRTVWLALDTGASLTVIRESALSAIGYSFKAAWDLATFGQFNIGLDFEQGILTLNHLG